MIGLHHAYFGEHRGAFDNRQKIALHALAEKSRPAPFSSPAILNRFHR
jgi:hypothetical protein